MTFENNLDPDEAPQNVGLHLRSKLFDIQIIHRHKTLVGNKDFLQILKKKIFKKNYPACKELNKTVPYNLIYHIVPMENENYLSISTSIIQLTQAAKYIVVC